MENTVFDFLGMRILTHYEAMMTIFKGGMPTPRMAIIYPTYVCNLHCVDCEYEDDNRDINIIMPEDRFRRLIKELADLGVQGIEFCGGGEPVLHPELNNIIIEASKLGMSTGLLTNGTMLKGKLAHTLITNSLYVRISLDAATGETFNKVKRPKSGTSFDKVIENIQNMLALRERLKTKIKISIKFLVSQDNRHEIFDAIKLGEELGVDSIQFKALRMSDDSLTDEQTIEVERGIIEARQRNPAFAIVGSVKKVNMDMKCWLTPLNIVIDPLGMAFLCCYYRHRKDTHCMGNVFEESLKKVWYSKRHYEAINSINPSECNNLDCRFVAYNRMMTKLIIEREGQLEFL